MTLVEANEFFRCWEEYPPVHILVKALAEGFGGKPRKENRILDNEDLNIISQLQRESKGSFPTLRGKDPGLPKSAPVFDLDSMREKNKELLRQKARKNG